MACQSTSRPRCNRQNAHRSGRDLDRACDSSVEIERAGPTSALYLSEQLSRAANCSPSETIWYRVLRGGKRYPGGLYRLQTNSSYDCAKGFQWHDEVWLGFPSTCCR